MAKKDLKDNNNTNSTENTDQTTNENDVKNIPVEDANEPNTNDADEKQNTAENESDERAEAAEKVEEKVETLDDKVKNLEEKYLRLSAEFDNYRKRTLRERTQMLKTAGEDVLLGMLPIVDNFERALQSIESAKDIDAVKEGINLIYNNFKDFLKQKGVKEIEAKGKPFDTDIHDAVTKIPAPSKDLKGKVVDVIEKGYYINDKVMRFAKVVVGD